MTRKFVAPSAEALERMHAISARQLSADEVDAGLSARRNREEMEQARALIRWFKKRYPTVRERLAYARRAHQQWARSMPRARTRSLTP